MKNEMNQRLLKVQKEWLESCKADMLSKEFSLSKLFCLAVTKQYIQSEHRVMVIGQEARDFERYENGFSLNEMQNFNENYVSVQLGYSENKEYPYNRSPFWNLFRMLKASDLEPIWNNADKFHCINTDEKTIPLTLGIERLTNISFGEGHISLLKREIEITEPDVVLFVTGPYYRETTATSLGIDMDALQTFCPDKSNPCRNITRIAGTGIPTFWSYHPAYLNRIDALSNTVEMIKTAIAP